MKKVIALCVAACLLVAMFATTAVLAAPEASTGLEYTTGASLGTIWSADVTGRNYPSSWGQFNEKSYDDPITTPDGVRLNGGGVLIKTGIVSNDEAGNLIIDSGDIAGNQLGQNFWGNESAAQQKVFQAWCEQNADDLTLDGKAVRFTVTGNYADDEFTYDDMIFTKGNIKIPGLPTIWYGRDYDPKSEPDVDLDKRIYISKTVPEEDIVSYNDIVVKDADGKEYTVIQKLTYPKGQAQTVIVELIMPDGFTVDPNGEKIDAAMSLQTGFNSCQWGTPVIMKGTYSPFEIVEVTSGEPGSETTTESAPDSTTESVPDTTAESVPETTTEFVPETTTEFVPETTTKPITADDVVIQADTVYAKAGERIEVPVRLTQAPKMWAMGWFAEFDNTKLTLVDVTGGDVFNEEFSEWVKPTEDLITRSNERGSYKFSAQYVGSDKEDVSGLLCTLVFEVNADAADADVYAIRITESYGDIITEDETDLPFVLLDGAVVIGEEPEQTTEPDTTGADVPDNTTATPDDTTVAPDDSTAAPDDSTAAPDDSTAASDDTTTTTSYIGGGDIGGTTPDMGAVAMPVGALILAAAAGVVLFKSRKK